MGTFDKQPRQVKTAASHLLPTNSSVSDIAEITQTDDESALEMC